MLANRKPVSTPPDAQNQERLHLLIETGLRLTSERSLEVVAQVALNAGLELCKAHYGVFFYNNTETHSLLNCRYKVAGRDGADFAALFHPESIDICSLGFPDGAIFSNDITTEPRSVESLPFVGLPPTHPVVRSYIAIPVRGRDNSVLGAMYYGHPLAAAFDPLAMDLVATVASQAANSIDNIRLSERLSREFATVDAARRLQRQTAERLRQALDAAQLGTWTWDRVSDQLDLDERAARLFHSQPHAFVTHTELRAKTVAPEDQQKTREAFERSVTSGSHYTSEYRVDGADGVQIWVSSCGVPIFAPDSSEVTGMIGTVQDITARRTHDSSLLQSEKLAATGRLAATIAHEINNPLEAVTNLIYLSRTDPEVPLSVRRLLETADSELARVSQIAQQTLGFYRDTTRPVDIDLNLLLHSVVDLFARKMLSNKIVCDLDLEPGLTIRGLQGEIRQVFSNLVVNAIDAVVHTGKGGRINIRGRHRHGTKDGVSILICDEGSGIPPHVRERVFSPFFTTKPTIGTGLGLWVTRGFVEKQGGSIRFRSCTEIRSGTIFRVVLPFASEILPATQLI
ncbi:MAG: PAS domain-containing protein [Acidobacteria bacterium]|nr:PAS domain-containing protein [Acidobacteriota bacterium]